MYKDFQGNDIRHGKCFQMFLISILTIICLVEMSFCTSAKTVVIPPDAVSYNGHFYYLFDLHSSWNAAKKFCESMGGHMATITSKAENNFVFRYIKKKGYYNVYFGLYKTGNGQWKWVTNEPVSYLNWAYGEPNDVTEKYAMFYSVYTDGKWNNGHFYSGDTIFLCEWDANSTKLNKVKKKGAQIKNGKAIYVVTKTGASPEVQYKMPLKKTYTSITIPATIKSGGIVYKVTSIASGACKSNKKLKEVVIGENVIKIGKGAFQSCKNLINILLKSSKVKDIGINAFKDVSKKAIILTVF